MIKNTTNFIDSSEDINYSHIITNCPKNKMHILHNHKDELEILIFLKGDCEFRVEGSVYKLDKYDTVIAANNEMHRIYHHSDLPYERIVITIHTDFFIKNNCEKYSNIFYNRALGTNNLIPYEITKNTDFINAVMRLEKYYAEEGGNAVISKSIIIEILHILSKCITETDTLVSYNKYIKDIITYINDNLTSDLNLDTISEHFFINKSYLCRIFKKHTGFTVNKYITHKRIMLVRELCQNNVSLSEASIQAGFGNYSNFYKMYVKETGQSPKVELKK